MAKLRLRWSNAMLNHWPRIRPGAGIGLDAAEFVVRGQVAAQLTGSRHAPGVSLRAFSYPRRM
ncbi:MAG TPA: hypothetical protein VM076_23610 [Gemmatimonadaceae bacterium]|nr:hypothetical protein [Gemmatimonadaceae bacterium]